MVFYLFLIHGFLFISHTWFFIYFSYRVFIYFSGGHPPYDSIQTVFVVIEVSESLYIGMSTLAGLGILFSLICLVFNIYFRKTRWVLK